MVEEAFILMKAKLNSYNLLISWLDEFLTSITIWTQLENICSFGMLQPY